jgi:hypothetical protein
MKITNNLLKSDFVESHQDAHEILRPDDRPLPSYARDLRVVGQLLERREISSADLVWVADTYIVRGVVQPSSKRHSIADVPRLWMTQLGAFLRGHLGPASSEVLNLRYNREEIVKFDHLAQTKRSGLDHMPDPYSLSHILRTVGAYLDGRNNSLLIGISLHRRWVTIRFETAEGRPEEATQDIQYFYDYWVKMYLRRGSRAQISLADQSIRTFSWDNQQRRFKSPYP